MRACAQTERRVRPAAAIFSFFFADYLFLSFHLRPSHFSVRHSLQKRKGSGEEWRCGDGPVNFDGRHVCALNCGTERATKQTEGRRIDGAALQVCDCDFPSCNLEVNDLNLYGGNADPPPPPLLLLCFAKCNLSGGKKKWPHACTLSGQS